MVVRTVSEGPPISTSYALSDLGTELAGAAQTVKSVATSPRLPALAV